METIFEEYKDHDKKDVLEMMEDFYAIDNYPFNLKNAETNLDYFTSNEVLGKAYLIKQENENIGYIILTFGFSFEYGGRDAFIDEFYIKAAFRNKGIGKKTLIFIEKQAEKLGIKAMHLEVEHHNLNAAHLYLKHGFKDNKRKLLTCRINQN